MPDPEDKGATVEERKETDGQPDLVDELKGKREERQEEKGLPDGQDAYGEDDASQPGAEDAAEHSCEDTPEEGLADQKPPNLDVMTISMAEDGSGLRLSWAAGMNMHDVRGVLKNADSILEMTMNRQAVKAEFQQVMTGVRPAGKMPGKGGVILPN